LYKRI